MPGEYGERRLCAWLVLCVVVMTPSLHCKIAFLYPVCYHECTAVNWKAPIMSKPTQFGLGLNQGRYDAQTCIAEEDRGGVQTGMPAAPLKTGERTEWLRGYVTGILQVLTETRNRNEPVPAQEGAGD